MGGSRDLASRHSKRSRRKRNLCLPPPTRRPHAAPPPRPSAKPAHRPTHPRAPPPSPAPPHMAWEETTPSCVRRSSSSSRPIPPPPLLLQPAWSLVNRVHGPMIVARHLYSITYNKKEKRDVIRNRCKNEINIITKHIVLHVLEIIFMIEISWIIGLIITINIV